jgi:hypothetical protein
MPLEQPQQQLCYKMFSIILHQLATSSREKNAPEEAIYLDTVLVIYLLGYTT